MNLFTQALSAIAPTLGGLVTNPLATNIISRVTELLTGKKVATEEELLSALQKVNPEILVELKKLDLELEQKTREVGLTIMNTEVADRNAAREHELKVRKGVGRSWTHSGLAFFIWGGCLVALFMAMFIQAEWTERAIFTILGTLTTVSAMVAGYYFGSSHGSLSKNELLNRDGKLGR